VTIDAAWQNFEEATKGSLEPEKLADFCVLSDNPLPVAEEAIRAISVERTVADGKMNYELPRWNYLTASRAHNPQI